MSYFKQNPEARKAYRARWADAWAKLVKSGGYSTDEEESVRIDILKKEAGVTSSNDLSEKGYTKVMIHLGILLGEGESKMKNPWRARRIYKIEEIAKELRPENPESYVIGVLDDMDIVRDPAKWRTALTDDYLHNLMLTMVSQQRREEKKRKGIVGGLLAEGGGRKPCAECGKPMIFTQARDFHGWVCMVTALCTYKEPLAEGGGQRAVTPKAEEVKP